MLPEQQRKVVSSNDGPVLQLSYGCQLEVHYKIAESTFSLQTTATYI